MRIINRRRRQRERKQQKPPPSILFPSYYDSMPQVSIKYMLGTGEIIQTNVPIIAFHNGFNITLTYLNDGYPQLIVDPRVSVSTLKNVLTETGEIVRNVPVYRQVQTTHIWL